MIGGEEGYVILEEVGEFSSEGRGKLWSSVQDYLGMEAKSRENMNEKELGNPAMSMFFVQG